MRVLVLGHKGMLGHMVCSFLRTKSIDALTVNSRWPTHEFKDSILKKNPDYIINCIGSIPQRKNNFCVNYDLPVWLDKNVDCKIIHPGTDCEIDNDEYGISKKNASEYIQKKSKKTKIIQTSIIGPELHTTAGLFEWVINSTGEINGWTGHMWNGNTTLEWSKICHNMIFNWEDYPTLTVPVTECISKFEIIKLITSTFKKDLKVLPENRGTINKCLSSTRNMGSLKSQLIELKKFMEDNL